MYEAIGVFSTLIQSLSYCIQIYQIITLQPISVYNYSMSETLDLNGMYMKGIEFPS